MQRVHLGHGGGVHWADQGDGVDSELRRVLIRHGVRHRQLHSQLSRTFGTSSKGT